MKKSKLITMAISLFAAICLWIYVVTVVNPDGSTTISNIPVTFSGADVLREDEVRGVCCDEHESVAGG